MTERPSYIGPGWTSHTTGLMYEGSPPVDLASETSASSSDPWRRLASIVEQAKLGRFDNVASAIKIAKSTMDVHLGNSAIHIFVLCAPSRSLPLLAQLFDHEDYDIRTESYSYAAVACDLALVEPLLDALGMAAGDDREYISGALWDLLECERYDDAQLPDLDHDYEAQSALARQMRRDLVERHGPGTAIYRGLPLSVKTIVATIRGVCRRQDYQDYGGDIDDMLGLLEAMTGVSRAGVLSNDVCPILSKMASWLNAFTHSGAGRDLEPGHRYFHGHRIPK